jgi:predicted P-loop ATPase
MMLSPAPWLDRSEPWKERPWTDTDDVLAADWFQHEGIAIPPTTVGPAIEAVARENPSHPVLNYLNALTWDGTARLDAWLVDHCGAADTPYSRAVGAAWMVSAVARVYRPGCKVDTALILESRQGLQKSSALRVLGGEWFSDGIGDLSSKDTLLQMQGCWIIELAELDAVGRSEVSRIKAFMSTASDRFRPPYAKRSADFPRQCVFAGTVNPERGYLSDPTGARRFWPVKAADGKPASWVINLARLAGARDQLWAEAAHRFNAGQTWWLSSDMTAAAEDVQAERYAGDAWDDVIIRYLAETSVPVKNGEDIVGWRNTKRAEALSDVSVGDVLKDALHIAPGKWTQADQNRVSKSLRSMGFERYQRKAGGQREWRYRRSPVF